MSQQISMRPPAVAAPPLSGALTVTPHHGYLARRGEKSAYIHFLIDGWAARYRLLSDGRRQITRIYVPGDLCEISSLTQPVAREHVVALLPLKTARVSHGQAREALLNEPRVQQMLWREQSEQSEIQSEWIGNLGRKTALERIAWLFCEMTERIGRVSDNGAGGCDMPMTQIDIADATGLTPVHVNRVLQEMRAGRLIELHAKRLKIFYFAQLAQRAFYPLRLFDVQHGLRFRALIDIVAREVPG